MEVIAAHEIKIYHPPIDNDDDDDSEELIAAMPFSVIGAEGEVSVNGKPVRGREYLWGVAQVENEEHCDFVKLRNLLIR